MFNIMSIYKVSNDNIISYPCFTKKVIGYTEFQIRVNIAQFHRKLKIGRFGETDLDLFVKMYSENRAFCFLTSAFVSKK